MATTDFLSLDAMLKGRESRPKALFGHIYSGSLTLGFSEFFDPVGQWEEGPWAADTARLNFAGKIPHHVGPFELWPNDPTDGDLDLLAVNPPCLYPGQLILTENGWKSIDSLVNTRSTAKVLALQSEGGYVFSPIVDWHKTKYTGPMKRIELVHTKGKKKYVVVTANHRFLTLRGWVSAGAIQPDDRIATGELTPNPQQYELIDGMLLGDATLSKQPQFGTSQTNFDLVELKIAALKQLVVGSGVRGEVAAADSGDGYKRSPQLGFYSQTAIWTRQERERWYVDGKKRVPRDVSLSDLALAVWYMDDGRGRGLEWSGRNEYLSRYRGPHLELATCGFTEEDNAFLAASLGKLGIIAEVRRRKSGYQDIHIVGDSANKLIERVGRYVPPSMRYKLPDWAPEYDPSSWKLGDMVPGWDDVLVEDAPAVANKYVYNLDIQDGHNYVTRGGVAHNCAPWSTIGGHKNTGDPRLIFTEHSFELAARFNPTFFVIESVPRAWSPTGGRELYTKYAEMLAEQGYATTVWFTTAVLHGIPQHRSRFHLIAHKLELDLQPPKLTHVPTVADVLEDLQDNVTWYDRELDPTKLEIPNHAVRKPYEWEANVMANMSQTENWRSAYATADGLGLRAKKHRLIAGRLRWDAPAQTLVDPGAMVHPLQDRFITIREAARICGYPDWFLFANGKDSTYGTTRTDVTQAVMSCIGSYLGKEFIRALDRGKPARPGSLEVIDFRPLAKDLTPRRFNR